MAKIMIYGTTSSAGKSTIATAMCRYYKDKGYKVCPFKSQNMSRNSFKLQNLLAMHKRYKPTLLA